MESVTSNQLRRLLAELGCTFEEGTKHTKVFYKGRFTLLPRHGKKELTIGSGRAPMLTYSAFFELGGDGFVVTFPDIPEAITEGSSASQAMEYAVDAVETVLSEYINRRREIPRPRRLRGKNVRLVRLPALTEAKIGLYRAMRAKGVRKADLARRLGWQRSLIDRLLNLQHASHLNQIEAALLALDKQLTGPRCSEAALRRGA